MSRRLLAISWDMPPLSGPRAVQVSRTLKHLVPLGWESSVICFGARSRRYNQDPELASRLRADGVTLVPVPSLEEHLFVRTLWRVVPPLKLLPDEKWVWHGAAFAAARRLAEQQRFDAIVSFAQPWSDHLIGRRLHRATRLPWVAHFSDPWTDSPYLHGRAWQRRIWRRMEAAVVREADALVFVNARTADRVMRKYPAGWRGKSHVVAHAFDDGAATPPPTPPSADGLLHIVYTGRFYDGIRTPEGFLRALARLRAERALGRELRVSFVGTPIESHARFASTLGLDDVVQFAGRVPFAESMRRAASADVLLVIDAPADESLFLPSKLIEYLPLGKPILGLTPRCGASADVIRALGYPVIAPDDERAIADALEDLIAARQDGRLTVSPTHQHVAQQYDCRHIARAFAEILARCL
jgi:glycosyltransferase involved in cell wall biosynthesis